MLPGGSGFVVGGEPYEVSADMDAAEKPNKKGLICLDCPDKGSYNAWAQLH